MNQDKRSSVTNVTEITTPNTAHGMKKVLSDLEWRVRRLERASALIAGTSTMLTGGMIAIAIILTVQRCG
jgi:hypothetical protein